MTQSDSVDGEVLVLSAEFASSTTERTDVPGNPRPWWKDAPTTGVLVLINVLLFVPYALPGTALPQVARTVLSALWNTPRLVTHEGHVWQLVTANFVHDGLFHLAVNMVFVLWFGSRLERLLGTGRYVSFYLLAGLFSHVVYDLGVPLIGTGGTTGGASGCVLAIVVLHALCFPKYELLLYGVIRVRFAWIVALLVISDLSSFLLPGGVPWVNSIVHLGGAAFGAICFFLVARKMVRHAQHLND